MGLTFMNAPNLFLNTKITFCLIAGLHLGLPDFCFIQFIVWLLPRGMDFIHVCKPLIICHLILEMNPIFSDLIKHFMITSVNWILLVQDSFTRLECLFFVWGPHFILAGCLCVCFSLPISAFSCTIIIIFYIIIWFSSRLVDRNSSPFPVAFNWCYRQFVVKYFFFQHSRF